MDEILTVAQIEVQFQSEWVLIEEPRTNMNDFTSHWS